MCTSSQLGDLGGKTAQGPNLGRLAGRRQARGAKGRPAKLSTGVDTLARPLAPRRRTRHCPRLQRPLRRRKPHCGGLQHPLRRRKPHCGGLQRPFRWRKPHCRGLQCPFRRRKPHCGGLQCPFRRRKAYCRGLQRPLRRPYPPKGLWPPAGRRLKFAAITVSCRRECVLISAVSGSTTS